LRFSLAGEGGLNDGTAFPFVMLGLGILGQHELGDGAWRWTLIDLLWGTVGGLGIGAMLGAMIGRLVVYLRTRHHQAVGLDEFLSLGLVALAYGVARICVASGFLAVFAAGLALQRVEERPSAGSVPLGISTSTSGHADKVLAAHSHYASATMRRAVHAFNAQLERLAELTLVLLVGAMLAYVRPGTMQWWFIPLFFVILRPVAVIAGTAGSSHDGYQRAMMSWFGIRGIGSVFYLMFAIRHGISTALAQQLATITLVTVAASIMLHGASVRPLMKR
jgi:NhaP-type Na+/H+ or K+/H+ antiporter